MILDTACARSVMGCPALTVEEADRTGIEYVFKNDDESLKFGASRRTSPLGCQYRSGPNGLSCVAVLACDAPFLLG